MIEINIPGGEKLELSHLILDYNGTMARDGILLSGVKESLEAIADRLKIHVITADTFGTVHKRLKGFNLEIEVIGKEGQDLAKKDFIQSIGESSCVCIGNGYNDHLMLKHGALGIVLIQDEGASSKAITASDIICNNFSSAIGLLLNPDRLKATLRR